MLYKKLLCNERAQGSFGNSSAHSVRCPPTSTPLLLLLPLLLRRLHLIGPTTGRICCTTTTPVRLCYSIIQVVLRVINLVITNIACWDLGLETRDSLLPCFGIALHVFGRITERRTYYVLDPGIGRIYCEVD